MGKGGGCGLGTHFVGRGNNKGKEVGSMRNSLRRILVPLPFLLAVVMVWASVGWASPSAKLFLQDTNFNSGEQQFVTTPDAAGQSLGKSCVDSSSGAVITVWTELDSSGNTLVKAQKVTPNGTRSWGDQGSTILQLAPPFGVSGLAVVCPGDGGVVVAAAGTNNAGDYRLRLQRVAADGSPQWGSPWTSGIIVSTDLNVSNPQLALAYDTWSAENGIFVGYNKNSAAEYHVVKYVYPSGTYKFDVAAFPSHNLDYGALISGPSGTVWLLGVISGDKAYGMAIQYDGTVLPGAGTTNAMDLGFTSTHNFTDCYAVSDLGAAGGYGNGAVLACLDTTAGDVSVGGIYDDSTNTLQVYNAQTALTGVTVSKLYGISPSSEGGSVYLFAMWADSAGPPANVYVNKWMIDATATPSFSTKKWTTDAQINTNFPVASASFPVTQTYPNTADEYGSLQMAAVGGGCVAYTWIDGATGVPNTASGKDIYAQVLCDDPAGTSAMPMFTMDDVSPVVIKVAYTPAVVSENIFLAAHGSAYVVALDDPDGSTTDYGATYIVNSFDWVAKPDFVWYDSSGTSTDLWVNTLTSQMEFYAAGNQIVIGDDPGTAGVTESTVWNLGQEASVPTKVNFYLTDSTDKYDLLHHDPGVNMIPIGSVDIPSIPVGGSYSIATTLDLSSVDFSAVRCWSEVHVAAIVAENEDPNFQELGYYNSNNVSVSADIKGILKGPDLQVYSAQHITSPVTPGDPIDFIHFIVQNVGTQDITQDFQVCFWLYNETIGGGAPSSFDTLEHNGLQLGCYTSHGLGRYMAPDWPEFRIYSLTIPRDVNGDWNRDGVPDSFRIYAFVDYGDAVNEVTEYCGGPAIVTGSLPDEVNFVQASNEFYLDARPDLWVDSSVVWPTNNVVSAGDTVQVSYRVENWGTGCSAPTSVYFYLSQDGTFEPPANPTNTDPAQGDVYLDQRPIPSLAPYQPGSNYSFSETVNLTVPAWVNSGHYYIYAYAVPPLAGGSCNAEINTNWAWATRSQVTVAESFVNYDGRNASPVEEDSSVWVNNGDWNVAPTSLCLVPGENANVNITGGFAPYQITTSPDAAVASAALSGSTVTVTANGVGTTSMVIDDTYTGTGSDPTAPFTVDIQVVDALAANPASPTIGVGGHVDVNITGGCGGLAIDAANSSGIGTVVNAQLNGNTLSVDGLAAGNATIRVMDDHDHYVDVSVTVNDHVTVSAPTCLAVGDTGTVNVTAGAPPYTVVCDSELSGCPGNFAGGSFTITADAVGSPTITATDASAASDTATVDVEPALAASTTALSVAEGESQTVTFTGGCGGCTLVAPPNSSVATVAQDGCTFTITGVAAGNTTFTVNDQVAGNAITVTVVVTPAQPITVQKESSCLVTGESETNEIYGGTAPYTVSCDAGISASVSGSVVNVDTTGSAPGTYTCTVDDSSNAAPATFTVTVVSDISVADASLSPYEGHDASTSVSGGCGAYNASSADGSIATASTSGSILTVHGVAPGSTTVTVCDSGSDAGVQHCANVSVDVLAYTNQLVINPTAFNLVPTQDAASEISGGAPPYTVSANSNPDVVDASVDGNSLQLHAKALGTSTIAVQDQFGATTLVTVQVNQNLSLNPSSLNMTQNSTSTVEIIGGFEAFTATSANSAVTASVSGRTLTLTSSSVAQETCGDVTVTDSAQPVAHSAVMTVCVYPAVVANPNTFNMTVSSSVTSTVSGGMAPYTVASSNDSVATASVSGDTVTINALAPGEATITVSDQLGQTFDISVTVYSGVVVNPSTMNLYVSQTQTVTVSGGMEPYTVSVDNADVVNAELSGSTLTLTGLAQGTATVTVTDALNQTATVTVNVQVPEITYTVNQTTFTGGEDYASNHLELTFSRPDGLTMPVDLYIKLRQPAGIDGATVTYYFVFGNQQQPNGIYFNKAFATQMPLPYLANTVMPETLRLYGDPSTGVEPILNDGWVVPAPVLCSDLPDGSYTFTVEAYVPGTHTLVARGMVTITLNRGCE